MTPRPFYRWKSFWLGIFVALFLAWGWWDSTVSLSFVSWRQLRFENAGGGISIEREAVPSTGRTSTEIAWGRLEMKVFASMFSNMKPVHFAAPFFLHGEVLPGQEQSFEQADSEKLKQASVSYPAFLKAFMRYEPRETWRAFIPHWLMLLAFVVPWSAFLFWRRSKTKRAISAPT